MRKRLENSPFFFAKVFRNEYFMVAFLLTCLLSLFFWRSIFLRQSLINNKLSITDPIYKELNIQVDPGPFFYPDPTYALQDRPFLLFSARTIASGYLPLWNPYHEGGTPFLANFLSSPLFPLKGILYLFPPLSIYTYYLIFCLGMAGFFTYLFCRLTGLSRYGAFFAATGYMLSGYLISYLQWNILVSLAALLPVVFITFQRTFLRKNLSSILLAGLALHLLLMAGNPTAAFVAVFSASLYFISLVLTQIRKDRRVKIWAVSIRNLALIGGLGILLTAVLFLPFLELLPHGYSYKEEPDNVMINFKRLGTDGLKSIASLFIPHYKSVWFISPLYRSNTYAYQGYCGLVTLVLAAYALFTKPFNWPLIAVLLFNSGFAFGIAPMSALNFVFPFNQIPAEYGLIPFSFSLIVLAGEGLDKILKNFKPLLFYGIISILSWITLNFFAGLSRSVNWLDSPWEEWKNLQFSISFFILILLLNYILKPSPRPMAFILLGYCDLFYNGYWINSPQPKFYYPETSPIQKLKSDESIYRILGMDGVSRLNTGMIHNLQDLQSYMTLILRRHREFMALGDPKILTGISTATEVYDSPLWDLMNVKYILRRSDKPIPSNKDFPLVYQNPYLLIYENLKAFPRAFVVPRVQVVESKSQALQVLNESRTSLRQVAILEAEEDKEALEKASVLNTSPPLQEGDYRVKIDFYHLHRVILTTELKIPGFLVLSDTIYPGWRVRVDGKEEKIYPTDYAIRGVFLDKGTHTVEFYYRPISFKLGFYLSLFGFLLTALGFTVCRGPGVRPGK